MIVWIFYLIGISFFVETLHEFYHFYFCSGYGMKVGILYIDNIWSVGGYTLCRYKADELIPTTLEILLLILLVIYKLKK